MPKRTELDIGHIGYHLVYRLATKGIVLGYLFLTHQRAEGAVVAMLLTLDIARLPVPSRLLR